MNAWFLVALLALVSTAGCFDDGATSTGKGNDLPGGAGPSNVRYTPPADPMPEGAGHSHQDAGQHKFLWNYEFASRDPMMQNAVNTAGVHALDVQAGYLFGSVYGSHAAAIDGGLAIWDLADPANPNFVGRWMIPGSVGGDRSMEATPDGDFAVISTEPADCAGHVNPGGVISAYLVDTRDKANPMAVDFVTFTGTVSDPTQPGGLSIHSVAVHRIGELDYAFLQGSIYRIDRTETSGSLVHVGDVSTGHDLYVRDTPWNTTWALAANGGGSGALTIWDVTQPSAPFVVAQWAESEPTVAHYYHTADVAFIDGNIIVVMSSEDWGEAISPLWVIDGNPLEGITEVPNEPLVLETLGTWQNPGNHSALAGLTFSLHNPRFHDGGMLTLSSYHGGMWQLDLRHPEFWTQPSPMAYAAYADGEPTRVQDPLEDLNPVCMLDIKLDAPSYWDVEVGPNGHLYLADGFMGLYAFKPAASHPVYGANRTVEFLGTAGT